MLRQQGEQLPDHTANFDGRRFVEGHEHRHPCQMCGLRDASTAWRDTPVCNICAEVLADEH